MSTCSSRLELWFPTYSTSMTDAHGSVNCTPVFHWTDIGISASNWKMVRPGGADTCEAAGQVRELAVVDGDALGRGRVGHLAEHRVAVRPIVEDPAPPRRTTLWVPVRS